MTITALSPSEARALVAAGAQLVDIRGPSEHARERIAGAVNLPLEQIENLRCDGRPVVFHCRSGMRTAASAAQLAKAAKVGPAYVLDGGIEAWRKAGLETLADRSQPIEIMRQVQIAAGSLVLIGVLLGLLLGPGFFGLAAFVGAGLVLAGATGWCGMATLLLRMPWNRRAA